MRSLAFVTLFISFSSFACPDLTGKYPVCRTEGTLNEVKDLTISQEVKNRVTFFTIESSEEEKNTYRADGKAVTMNERDEDSGMNLQTTTTAICSGNELKVKMTAKFGSEVFLDVVRTYSKDGNQVTFTTVGKMADVPVSNTVICE